MPMASSIHWRRSSYSDSSGFESRTATTDAAPATSTQLPDPEGPKLAFGRAAFGALVRDIRAGRYDR